MSKGQPRGLAVLALTETWERFSFYGMQALLLLYLVNTLVPGAAEQRVLGFSAFRAATEAVTGPLSTQAFASQIVGLYSGLVYLTPLAGGLIGDRLLGRRATVLLGAVLMAAGHLWLATDAFFLIALGLLVAGSGCLKGNIATQVGQLYAPGDHRRDRAFLWFNLGINLGAFAGPLVCGTIGETSGAHLGFVTAGLGMLAGIAVYVAGWRHLPPSEAPEAAPIARSSTAGGRRRIGALIALIATGFFYNLPFAQGYIVLPLWIAKTVDRHLGSVHIPVAWYLACDGLITVLATPIVIAWWRRQAACGGEPGSAAKLALGAAAMAGADLLLALLSRCAEGGLLGPGWTIGYFVLSSSAYLFVIPVLLAAVSRAAPPRLAGTLMGLVYASLFVSNLTAGWLARFYAPLGATAFWLLQAAIALGGTFLAIALRRALRSVDEAP